MGDSTNLESRFDMRVAYTDHTDVGQLSPMLACLEIPALKGITQARLLKLNRLIVHNLPNE